MNPTRGQYDFPDPHCTTRMDFEMHTAPACLASYTEDKSNRSTVRTAYLQSPSHTKLWGKAFSCCYIYVRTCSCGSF